MSEEVTIYPQTGQYWFLFFTCHVLGEENRVKELNPFLPNVGQIWPEEYKMSAEVTIYPQAGQYWFLFFTCHILGEENTAKGLIQRGLKYTEEKPLGRLCKMCNPFLHEVRVVPSAKWVPARLLCCYFVLYRDCRLED